MSGRKQSAPSLDGPSRLLAERLKAERQAHGLSQESVARTAGLALSTVRKIEANQIREPGIFTVLALWRALQIPPAALAELIEVQVEH